MVVLNQIHRKLSGIFDNLFTDTILNECFLEQDVTAVFFVREDRPQIRSCPFHCSCRILEAAGFQGLLDAAQCLAG